MITNAATTATALHQRQNGTKQTAQQQAVATQRQQGAQAARKFGKRYIPDVQILNVALYHQGSNKSCTRGGQQVTGAEADANENYTAKPQQDTENVWSCKTNAEYNALIRQQTQRNAEQLAALDKAGKRPKLM